MYSSNTGPSEISDCLEFTRQHKAAFDQFKQTKQRQQMPSMYSGQFQTPMPIGSPQVPPKMVLPKINSSGVRLNLDNRNFVSHPQFPPMFAPYSMASQMPNMQLQSGTQNSDGQFMDAMFQSMSAESQQAMLSSFSNPLLMSMSSPPNQFSTSPLQLMTASLSAPINSKPGSSSSSSKKAKSIPSTPTTKPPSPTSRFPSSEPTLSMASPPRAEEKLNLSTLSLQQTIDKAIAVRSASPNVDVETVEPTIKKSRMSAEEMPDTNKYIANTSSLFPNMSGTTPTRMTSTNTISAPAVASKPVKTNTDMKVHCEKTCCQNSDEETETRIIITTRPRANTEMMHDDMKSSGDSSEESDYDSSLRPKETPLQYKDRMVERAKKKNLASKKSREKRKREHEDRQHERQKLEQRNIELSRKLMELRDSLTRLRPQICQDCNTQVQAFLDKCSQSDTMNVFVLKQCSKADCRGNKNYKPAAKF